MRKAAELMRSGRQAMRERRFAEAIALFEARLAEAPGDLEAMLQLGFCHLLNRSERLFLRMHDEARALVEGMAELPEALAKLWRQYRSLVGKVSAAALVMGSATLSSCSRSAHKYSGGVYETPRPQAEEAEEAAPALDLPQSAHKYSGGVFKAPVLVPPADGDASKDDASKDDASKDDASKEDAANEDAAPAAGPAKPLPAPPVSAHRYSGGVFKAPREAE